MRRATCAGAAVTRVIAALSRPADVLYEFRRALAIERLVNALWRECVALGKSDLWVAREYERILGVPMYAPSADNARAGLANRPAASRRKPAAPR